MKFKSKIFIILLILSILCTVSCISAEDTFQDDVNNLTDNASAEYYQEEQLSLDNELNESDVGCNLTAEADLSDENLTSESNLNESDDKLACEDNHDVIGQSDDDKICTIYVNESTLENLLKNSENTLISKSLNQETSILSDDDSAYNIYMKSIKTRYNSGKSFKFGWTGKLWGYFKVFKGNTLVHDEWVGADSGVNKYAWKLKNLPAGFYITKLVSYDIYNYDNYKTVASAYIRILKTQCNLLVSSFSARSGSKVYCYAYVSDKFDGSDFESGTVKFRVNGKTYKARVKYGFACAKIKIPYKVKTYTCKATFLGTANVHSKSVHFKIKVKKSRSKISVKSFSATSGTRGYCYAYVKDKFSGEKIKRGAVKFKINGKTYRTHVKNGVAKVKITVPYKAKKYTCKATFYGNGNIYGKSTKFRITVKQNPAYYYYPY